MVQLLGFADEETEAEKECALPKVCGDSGWNRPRLLASTPEFSHGCLPWPPPQSVPLLSCSFQHPASGQRGQHALSILLSHHLFQPQSSPLGETAFALSSQEHGPTGFSASRCPISGKGSTMPALTQVAQGRLSPLLPLLPLRNQLLTGLASRSNPVLTVYQQESRPSSPLAAAIITARKTFLKHTNMSQFSLKSCRGDLWP